MPAGDYLPRPFFNAGLAGGQAFAAGKKAYDDAIREGQEREERAQRLARQRQETEEYMAGAENRKSERELAAAELKAKKELQPRRLALGEAELGRQEAESAVASALAKRRAEPQIIEASVRQDEYIQQAGLDESELKALVASGAIERLRSLYDLHAAMAAAGAEGDPAKAVEAFNKKNPQHKIRSIRRPAFGETEDPDMFVLEQEDGGTVYVHYNPKSAVDTFQTQSLAYRPKTLARAQEEYVDAAARGDAERAKALHASLMTATKAQAEVAVQTARTARAVDPRMQIQDLEKAARLLGPSESMLEQLKEANKVVVKLAEFPGSPAYQDAVKTRDAIATQIQTGRQALAPIHDELLKLYLEDSSALLDEIKNAGARKNGKGAPGPSPLVLPAVPAPSGPSTPAVAGPVVPPPGDRPDLTPRSRTSGSGFAGAGDATLPSAAAAAKALADRSLAAARRPRGSQAEKPQPGQSVVGAAPDTSPVPTSTAGGQAQNTPEMKAAVEKMTDNPVINFFLGMGPDLQVPAMPQGLKAWQTKMVTAAKEHEKVRQVVEKAGGQDKRDFDFVQDFLSSKHRDEAPPDSRDPASREAAVNWEPSVADKLRAVQIFNKNLGLLRAGKSAGLSELQLQALRAALGVSDRAAGALDVTPIESGAGPATRMFGAGMGPR